MIPTIKSEFKKLLTVPSTYVLLVAFLALASFVAFYVHGYKDAGMAAYTGPSALDHARASLFVAGTITSVATLVSLPGAFIALLLLAHEYRYNTIVYSLTASNSRSKVLAAKIIAVLGLVFVYSIVATAICLAMVWLGAAASGHSLPAQDLSFLTFFAKSIFFSEAYAMAALVFIALIRNQVGAIAALLVLPNTIESLLSLLLKSHSVYLPFMALSQVIQAPLVKNAVAAKPQDNGLGSLTPGKGALVYLIYLVIGWVIAWYLFLRRDAS